jgi:hypothetical protein
MKKNIIWASCSFAIMLAMPPARMQARPDFTGTWIVEKVERPERPSGGREGRRGPGMGGGMRGSGGRAGEAGGGRGPMAMPEKGQRLRVKQSVERLIVTTPHGSDEQMNTYALDGSESTNTSERGTVKSRTKWEGAALVTEGTRKFEGPMGEVTLKSREVRSLSEDGRTMVVRTTVDTPRGQMTSTVTFVRAEQ